MKSLIFRQRTIEKAVEITGIGLHSGEPINLRLEPMPENSGIIFYRIDKAISIPAEVDYIVDTRLATVLGRGEVRVSTIEHLLSAIFAYGIDNLKIILDGPEVPIMDGSSISFCLMLDEAGIKLQDDNKKVLVVKKKVVIEKDGKRVGIFPSSRLEYDFTIRFNHPLINEQKYKFVFSRENYIKEIARARTFGFLKDVQYLRSIGLIKGGSFENAIVLDDSRVLNSDGLRFKDEFVRHKILDAIGDLSLLGLPIIGRYESIAGSHYLNSLLSKRILEEKGFEIVSSEEELKELAKIFA